ncbi:TPA: hypothetical protein O9R57_002627 [Staphylococcus aureus]|uniref:hypothetical protein n=1 Tax=Staphylococcus TaxID=1279 RepID=UPI000D1C6F88|nr:MULTISPECIES: hypothetical protein [Staphylococcus]PTE71974.1 hypothetical protein BUY50_04290 [Staphylococcus epidermidis]RIL24082.1 hypothetical protein BUY97_07965 [Staphylococcus gallinarum]HDC9782864.1 hypothetical protein [Staphylococcus aureus]
MKKIKQIMNTDELNNENQQLIKKIEKAKAKTFILPFLCMILMFLELLLDIFMNINTFTLIVITFIFFIVINVYVLYKLQTTKKLLNTVLTAHHNKLDINELYNIDEERLKSIRIIAVSWRSFLTEYVMIAISIYMCVSIPFVSYINNFM